MLNVTLFMVLSVVGPLEDRRGTAADRKVVSEGKTELEGQGKFEAGMPIDDIDADATQLEVIGGALLNTGNSGIFASTIAGKFLLRRRRHQFTTGIAGNYGLTQESDRGVDVWEVNTENIQGRVRYDVFFTRRWYAFYGTSARRDRFQGLDLRLNTGPGVGVYILKQKKHRLWSELGYDFQYDLRRDDSRVVLDSNDQPVLDASGQLQLVAKTGVRHAARLFAGYLNKISDVVSFDTGIEYLQSVVKPDQIRVNWNLGLTTEFAKQLAFATTFVLRFDNDPLPGVRALDTNTSVSLIYRFF